ncbi:hypothetical protein PRIPAC_89039, partial [Pristionchus pacificus]|uniref:Uncharacterized protein n=1 Tax=Pristionchus pacificus TaxID=54126 RepID=A0A2A6B935_PRIPA
NPCACERALSYPHRNGKYTGSITLKIRRKALFLCPIIPTLNHLLSNDESFFPRPIWPLGVFIPTLGGVWHRPVGAESVSGARPSLRRTVASLPSLRLHFLPLFALLVSTACGLLLPPPYSAHARPHTTPTSIRSTMASKTTKDSSCSLRTAREQKSCRLTDCTTSQRSAKTTTSTALLQHGSHTQPTTCCTIGCPTKANWLARLLLHFGGYYKAEHHHHTEPSLSVDSQSHSVNRHHLYALCSSLLASPSTIFGHRMHTVAARAGRRSRQVHDYGTRVCSSPPSSVLILPSLSPCRVLPPSPL